MPSLTNPPPLTTAIGWQIKTSNYLAKSGDRIVANLTSSAWALTLPANPAIGEEIQVLTFGAGSNALSIDPNGKNLNGASTAMAISADRLETRFVFVGAAGWISAVGGGSASPSPSPSPSPGPSPSPSPATSPAAGMEFWINGDFTDLSGNENHLVPMNVGQLPEKVTGLDGKPVLYWDGTYKGELTTNHFLEGATAATLYAVFTVDPQSAHYDLFQTNSNDAYWRFANNGSGYFGSFLGGRINEYPAQMPGSGAHLVVIFAKPDTYEVHIDNVSQGVRNVPFFPGYFVRICPNNRGFKGTVATELVYTREALPAEHLQNLQYLKARYPSLPYTLS